MISGTKKAVFVVTALSLGMIFAALESNSRPWRVDQIPNGDVFQCMTCHNSNTGGALNPFGRDVGALLSPGSIDEFWGPALAILDSDGDGATNGEELGDPEGAWRPGDPDPIRWEITNPGDPNSTPSDHSLVFVNKPPDIILGLGDELVNAFNLNDFFSSTSESDFEFEVVGPATVDLSGNVSFHGSSEAGIEVVIFSHGDASVASHVVYTPTVLGNRPFIDDNNRIASMEGGNMFLNALVPGTSVRSNLPLTGIEAILQAGGGDGFTPGGVTPAGGSLIAAIGDFDFYLQPSGFIKADKRTVSAGDGFVAYESLSVTIDADGFYTISADEDFDGVLYVTVGADGGSYIDVVHMLAVPSKQIGGEQSVTVDADGGQEIITLDAIDLDDTPLITLVADYSTDSSDVKIGLIALEANGAFHFTQPGGANLTTDGIRQIAFSFMTTQESGGTVSPMIQIDNLGGSAANVTIHGVQVVWSPPLTIFSTNLNSSLDLPIDGSMSEGLVGWMGDVLDQSEGGPVLDASRNLFEKPSSAGAALLAGAQHESGVANMGFISALTTGTYTLEAFVKSLGGDGLFFMVVTDGGPNTLASVVPSHTLRDEWNWKMLSTTGVESAGAFVVFQAAGCDIVIDDVSIKVIDELDVFFDVRLTGISDTPHN